MRQLHAIHTGHVQVKNRQVVGLVPLRGGTQHLQGFCPVLGLAVLHTPGDDLSMQYLAVSLVVIDYEDTKVFEIFRRNKGDLNSFRLLLQPRGEPEGAPFPNLALDAYLSTHHLGQVLTYRKPKSRAAVASCGGGITL